MTTYRVVIDNRSHSCPDEEFSLAIIWGLLSRFCPGSPHRNTERKGRAGGVGGGEGRGGLGVGRAGVK